MSDYISREAVMELRPKNIEIINSRAYIELEELITFVDGIPAADAEPVLRWIPCSERLPETDGPYLVVNKATGWIGVYNFSRVKNFPYFGPQVNAWWRLDDDWYPQSCNATHWMPLPEPPTEGSAGNGMD